MPEPHAVTLIEHQSLVKLPPPGFVPRLADARTGAISATVTDYSAPLGSPLVYRLASRFRLEKTDPAAARSPVKKPIVFYVDRAAPEPIRAALVEGARWWAQAFDAAGFIDAFKVEVLPPGVSPLDARYNVINWVHRQTRGWSLGYPLSDPRTGEIVEGARCSWARSVCARTGSSSRAWWATDKTGSGAPDDPIVVSLARLHQLSVHETGHALGLEHNFAASTFGDRASVMDYPAPRIGLSGDKLDFSDAYKVGIGDWDRFAIHWLYADVPSGEAGRAALEKIVRDGYAQGLRYVRDEDARPTGSAQPDGALWDDGADPVASLEHVMAIRKLALARFGPANIPAGAPLSDLRRVIVPIYLFHRYEVDAVAKSIGGVTFTYATRDDGLAPAHPVTAAAQRRALSAILATLDPAVLGLPGVLIDQLSQGFDGAPDRQYETELFGDPASPVFDIDAAAAAAADITLGDLLEPSRLRRVENQGAGDPGPLGLAELFEPNRRRRLRLRAGPGPSSRPAQGVVRARLVAHLAGVLQDKATSAAVSAEVRAALDRLGHQLASRGGEAADQAQAHDLAALILNRSHDDLASLAETDKGREPAPPPGMPIGDGEDDWFSEPAHSHR